MIAVAERFLCWTIGLLILLGICVNEVASAEVPAVRVGDIAPGFQATDQEGRVWKSKNYYRMRNVVVFFYPGDFCKSCVRQIHNYQKHIQRFGELGVVVVGISGDTVKTHRKFTDLHKLDVTLLSDFDGNVARSFRIPVRDGGRARVTGLDGREVFPADNNRRSLTVRRGVTCESWTVIVGREGAVIYKKRNTHAVKDAQTVLQFLDRKKSKDN